jgi:AraC-like DNA-binding protein
MIMVQVIRLALGEDWKPARLRIQQKREATLADNDWLLGSNIEFGTSTTGIELPLGKLATKTSCSDPEICLGVGSCPASHRASFPADPLSALQELISNHIRQSKKASIDLAAEMAGVCPRTLQRYLSSKATSYSRLVDQVRFNMAVPLLIDDSVSICEIASELGYANVAHFSRAFCRITGMSPRSYRHLLKE